MGTDNHEILVRIQSQVECLQRGEVPEPISCDDCLDPVIVELCREVNRLTFLYGEALPFVRALAQGKLEVVPPSPSNLLASSFKQLHSSLLHLTWQTRQIADGDYSQRVNFMGAFSSAFNSMIETLEGRRLIEDALRDSEATLRAFFDHTVEAILIHDFSGRILKVNERMLEMFDVTAEEALRLSLWHDYSAEGTPSALLDHHWTQALEGKKQIFEWKAKRPKDGGEFDVRIYFCKIHLSHGDYVLTTISDISPLKQVEIELRRVLDQVAAEKAKSEAIMAAISVGLTVQAPDFTILYQNQVCKNIIGEHEGEKCYRAYEGNDSVCPGCPVAVSFADGGIHTAERHVRLDGEPRIFENTASPITDPSGKVIAVVELSRDITKRRETENRVRQISNLYEALSNTNKAIMHSRDLNSLFRDICALAVKYGKFCLAGIAVLEEQTGIVKPVAHSGSEQRYFDSILVSSEMDLAAGRGPTGFAMREGRPYVCNDYLNDPVTRPWHEAALNDGIRASAVFPLQCEGKPYGVFKVYAERTGFFDDNMFVLLLEMAENISFAIDNFVREERRKKAEEALRENEERMKLVLEGSNDGFWDWNIATGEVAFSRRYAEMLGFAPEELEPSVAGRRKQIHPEDWPQVEACLNEHLAGANTAYEVEFRLRTKAGQWEWVLDRGRIVKRGEDGEPLRMAGTSSVITERKQQEEDLNYVVTHDVMTDLYNRAYYDAELARLAKSRHFPVGIVIADIDGLKLVNDGFGHLEGDRLIKLAARCLRDSFRPEDVVARIGGDEFAVLLPETDAETLQTAVKRVLHHQELINAEDRDYMLSISIGTATAENAEQFKEALHLADSRMYYYKFQRKMKKV